MAQAKADRSAAAKKAAATRQRNQAKAKSQSAGTKAAATRQGKAAGQAADQAKRVILRERPETWQYGVA